MEKPNQRWKQGQNNEQSPSSLVRRQVKEKIKIQIRKSSDLKDEFAQQIQDAEYQDRYFNPSELSKSSSNDIVLDG